MHVLSILHNIAISPEQARKLHAREEVEVIGASVPVWYFRGNTSEPAEEVFCKYRLTNNKKHTSIQIEEDGYVINIPQPHKGIKKWSLSDEAYLRMTPEELNQWYEEHPAPTCSLNLLPRTEGGSEYLYFNEYTKVRKKDKTTLIIHMVEIKYEEVLLRSLA
jgi:hypothetical protein